MQVLSLCSMLAKRVPKDDAIWTVGQQRVYIWQTAPSAVSELTPAVQGGNPTHPRRTA